jgi:hypothetical protein
MSRCVLCGSLALALASAAVPGATAGGAQKPEAIYEELIAKRQGLRDEAALEKLFKGYAAKLVSYAEDNPGDGSAVDALLYVLKIPRYPGKDSPHERAFAILAKDHVENPRFGKLRWLLECSPLDAGFIGAAAPEAVSKGLDGKEVRLSHLKGNVVVGQL